MAPTPEKRTGRKKWFVIWARSSTKSSKTRRTRRLVDVRSLLQKTNSWWLQSNQLATESGFATITTWSSSASTTDAHAVPTSQTVTWRWLSSQWSTPPASVSNPPQSGPKVAGTSEASHAKLYTTNEHKKLGLFWTNVCYFASKFSTTKNIFLNYSGLFVWF